MMGKMIIPQEIVAFFGEVPIMAFATADKDGIPNVVAIASKKIINDNTIITIDTFHDKTIRNIKQNSNVSIAMWKDSVGYQIVGKAEYYTKGKIFDAGKEWILKLKPQKIVKGVIEIKVTDIYYLTPDYKLAGESVIKDIAS